MPESIDVLLVCPRCGPGPKPIVIDGTRFCSRCMAHYLRQFQAEHVPVMEMRQVRKEYDVNDPSGPKTYCSCGHSWHGAGASCPKCGKVDHLPQFSAEDWHTIKGRGRVATVRWPSQGLRKRDVNGRRVVIDGTIYTVNGIEAFAIPEPECFKHPVGLLVSEAGDHDGA